MRRARDPRAGPRLAHQRHTGTSITFAGCEAVETIFQAGVWVDAILVVLIIAIVGLIAAKIQS